MKNEIDVSLLKKFIASDNICDYLEDYKINEIGDKCYKGAEEDGNSLSEWYAKYEEALKIARQIDEIKSYPWEKASNIKLPLILVACIQFNSMILPEIIQDDKTVKAQKLVPDPTGQLDDVLERISDHMSVQTTQIDKNWESDTDALTLALGLIGTFFRKWTYDPIDKEPKSYLCYPDEILVNYAAPNLSKCRRITHVLYMSKNEILENIRAGIYRDVDITSEQNELNDEDDNYTPDPTEVSDQNPFDKENKSNLLVVHEQHTWLDLDDDGYEEPYIVTYIKDNSKVLSIKARFNENGFVYKDKKKKGNVIKIKAKEYFTRYIFIPPFDNSIMGQGFGQLMLPLSKACNTLVNQIVDSGTLANLPSGFISESLRIRKRDMQFTPGEFKIVNSKTGQSLQDSIVTLPIKEPSAVLFQLLSLLIDQTKAISAVSDVMQGQMPPANTPAETVLAMIQQGSKIFSSIMKRIYKSLRDEFNILYELNKEYFSEYDTYQSALESGVVTIQDYLTPGYGILPIANPNVATDSIRTAQLQFLMQFKDDPMFNGWEIRNRALTVTKIPDKEKIIVSQEQLSQPSPQELLAKAEMEKMQTEIELNKAKVSDIMARIEIDSIKELGLGEQRIQMDDAWRGAQVATDKISSIVELSAAENTLPPQTIDQATQTVEAISKESEPNVQDVNAELTNLFSTLNNLQQGQGGVSSQQNQIPQQAAQNTGGQSQGQEQVSPENVPNPSGTQDQELTPELQQQLLQAGSQQQ